MESDTISPYGRRLAPTPPQVHSRPRADVLRYCFISADFHHLLFASIGANPILLLLEPKMKRGRHLLMLYSPAPNVLLETQVIMCGSTEYARYAKPEARPFRAKAWA